MSKWIVSLNNCLTSALRPAIFLLFVAIFASQLSAQDNHDHAEEAQVAIQGVAEHGEEAGHDGEFDIQNMIFNHINNSNEFHLFNHVAIPLPCILWAEDGITYFMSSKLDHGHVAYKRYVLDHGVVKRVKDVSFPEGEVEVGPITHEKRDGAEIGFVEYNNRKYELEGSSTMVKQSSFWDISISKNVVTMLIAAILLIIVFTGIANAYKKRANQAPTGAQNFFEIIVLFIIDEVAKPMLGDRYMRFLPFLLTIFFFILTLNLMGLIPFAPFSSNVTGNLATTMALALITFILTNINGNGNYWKHIFWMPGLPVAMKIFLAPIELIGVFTKPISLMIRLFANITAGHIIILSLVGLIFVFGQVGQNVFGAGMGALVAVPFTMFMNLIELVVALIQAFIFTILSASYIGAATEEAHH